VLTLKRSHGCGELSLADAGKDIVLMGWVDTRRDLGGVVFIELRDRSGVIQVVFSPEHNPEVHQLSAKLRSEYVIAVKGKLSPRPDDSINKNLTSGNIEVYASHLEILNSAKTPPFEIADDINVDESLRLKYRYLDLRRPKMQQNLRLRHKVTKFMRDYLDRNDFYEIETPILTKSTPEGARDYLVPSRVQPGNFYALPQSPQIFKQILMLAGYEKYFQIARCFRDEDLRGDRQPEFTQLDVEMSFVNQEDVLNMLEGLVVEMIKEVKGIDIPSPIKRLTYHQAMNLYGSDKPDTRFGLELTDLTELMAECGFNAFADLAKQGGSVKALKLPKMSDMARNELDNLRAKAVKFGAKGLTWFIFNEDGSLKSPVAKFFTEEEVNKIKETAAAENGDVLLVVADKFKVVCDVLGRFRLDFGKKLNLIDETKYDLMWVVDFPVFEWNDQENRWDAMHHPFTSIKAEDIGFLDTDPGRCRANAYDLVLNGNELGSGSIRIHNRDMQERIFRTYNLTEEQIKNKFGFMLDAFEYGCPPHGGIALGLDRLVMILAGEANIREIIPFPKTNTATCLMTEAPGNVDNNQLKELHIKTVEPVKISAD